ncbi:MAG: type II toxin-antitoxin system RelE/ParE family toxin [Candidatus Aenigmatarchaeota archaeon]
MTYQIIFSDEALSVLRKLETKDSERILAKFEAAASNPNHFFERLEGREDYKLRAGDFRALAKIDHENKTIFVVTLGHRKNVYKRN